MGIKFHLSFISIFKLKDMTNINKKNTEDKFLSDNLVSIIILNYKEVI